MRLVFGYVGLACVVASVIACSEVEPPQTINNPATLRADKRSTSNAVNKSDAPRSQAPRGSLTAAPSHARDAPMDYVSDDHASEPPSVVPEEFIAVGPCTEATREVGSGFKMPWGTTPRDVMKLALGAHRTPLTWRHEEAFSYGVEGTSTTLLVELTRGKGPITFVERSVGQGDDLIDYECPSALSIPVHVKATTQDNVISIEGDSELIVTSPNSIVMTFYVARPETLRILNFSEEGTVVDSFEIALAFGQNRAMVGVMGGGYKCADENCLHIPYAYACFPERPPFQIDDFIFHACGR